MCGMVEYGIVRGEIGSADLDLRFEFCDNVGGRIMFEVGKV